ncbi:MAG: PQQ-dependent sugar dehydrogenase [Hyphomicrobium sp.]
MASQHIGRAFLLITLLISSAAGAAPKAAITNAPAAPASAITVSEIAKGLEFPWGLQFLPDGRFLVTERPGRIRFISKDGKVSEPVAGMPHVVGGGQGGLLDVALAPDFATSGTIFFSYAEPRGSFSNGTSVVRAKLVTDGESGRIENGEVIFRQEPAARGFHHFGSRLVFDQTGALFITLGERASLSDGAQDLSVHLGKIVRILPDGSVPKDNPYADAATAPEGARPEIWSYGHRNVQGAVIDPATGHLWTTEHGPRGGDELNQPQKGKNYGWPVITYGLEYSGDKVGDGISAKDGLEQPDYYWKPSIGTSGLALYTGTLFPGWKGNLIAGGLSGMTLERLVIENGAVVAVEHLLKDRKERIRDVRMGPDGAVYVLTDDDNGKLLRLTPKS